MNATTQHTTEARIRDVLSCEAGPMTVREISERIHFVRDPEFRAKMERIRHVLSAMVARGELVRTRSDKVKLAEGSGEHG